MPADGMYPHGQREFAGGTFLSEINEASLVPTLFLKISFAVGWKS
jgi:hypothetical protein